MKNNTKAPPAFQSLRVGAALPLVLAGLLAPALAGAQRVAGTVEATKPPTGETPAQLAAAQEFQLRKMGYSDATVEQNRETVRAAAEREAAGLQASGEFEYARDGSRTYYRTAVTTTIPGQACSVLSERYDGETTILTVDGTAQVYAGDARRLSASPILDIALLGLVPAGFAEVRAEGGTTVYDRTEAGLWERLEVARRADGSVARAVSGYVTPEQSRKAGEPAFRPAATAERDASGERVTIRILGNGTVVETQEIRLSGGPAPTDAAGWPMPKPGMQVVDMRTSDTKAYAFSGTLPPARAGSAGQAPKVPAGAAWLGAGLLAVAAGVRIARQR